MDDFDADAYVSAAAPAVGLVLSDAERGEVAVQLRRIHAFAKLVLEAPLAPEDEPAMRFEP